MLCGELPILYADHFLDMRWGLQHMAEHDSSIFFSSISVTVRRNSKSGMRSSIRCILVVPKKTVLRVVKLDCDRTQPEIFRDDAEASHPQVNLHRCGPTR